MLQPKNSTASALAQQAAIDAMRAGIRSEREMTSHLWTILNELRLHSKLPDWAEQLVDGRCSQMEEIHAVRGEVNQALFTLIPGLREQVEQSSGSSEAARGALESVLALGGEA